MDACMVRLSPRLTFCTTTWSFPQSLADPGNLVWIGFSRLAGALIVGVGTLLIVCLTGLVIMVQSLLPLRHAHARQIWEQNRVNHYELEVEWETTWSRGHVRAEIRDDRIVGGVDLDSGRPLVPLRLENAGYGANYFMVVEHLFNLIEAQTQAAGNWRTQAARYHPLLAHALDPCAVPMPRVRYDDTFGHPTHIHFFGSPCRAQGEGKISIKRFQPLP